MTKHIIIITEQSNKDVQLLWTHIQKTSKVVVCELSDGTKIEYPSARKAAKLLGVSSSTIINRCNGKYDEYNGMKFYYK